MGANITTMIMRMSHGEMIVRVEPFVRAFSEEPYPIDGPIPTFLVVGTPLKNTYDQFKEAHKGAETGEHTSTAQRNALRMPFNQIIIDLADFVELASRKDATLPYRAGLEYFWRKKSGASHTASLTAPVLTVVNAPDRGSVYGKCTVVNGAKSYEVQFTYGDPTVEENWSHLAIQGKASKMLINNLDAGKTCSLRARAVGANGNGPWSNHVTLIIT